MTLDVLLRLAGLSILLLALLHAVFWWSLNWRTEVERLSPLNARVFAVHTFFVALVLFGLGLLSLLRPDLLLARSELARLMLVAVVVFWFARLLMQPLVFDGVMREGWTQSRALRISVNFVWGAYVVIYGAALFHQLTPVASP